MQIPTASANSVAFAISSLLLRPCSSSTDADERPSHITRAADNLSSTRKYGVRFSTPKY